MRRFVMEWSMLMKMLLVFMIVLFLSKKGLINDFSMMVVNVIV